MVRNRAAFLAYEGDEEDTSRMLGRSITASGTEMTKPSALSREDTTSMSSNTFLSTPYLRRLYARGFLIFWTRLHVGNSLYVCSPYI